MIVVGISGGSGSGKTTFVRNLHAELANDQIPVLAQDSYYRDNSHITLEERKKQNYDHPNAIEWELMIQHLHDLHQGQTIHMPTYSMLTCTRTGEYTPVHPAEILIVEGILIYTHPALRELMHLRVFLDVDESQRYERVLRRDMKCRGRSAQEVAQRYHSTVAPMYQSFIFPSSMHANIFVPGGGKNVPAVKMLAGLIRSL